MSNHSNEVNIALRLGSLDNDKEKIEAIKSVLNSVNITGCLVDEMESKIFLPVLPFCKDIYFKILESVESLLKGSSKQIRAAETVTESLRNCIDLLQTINDLLLIVNKLGSKKVDHFYSITQNVGTLLFSTFKHCQMSEVIYSDMFSTVSELLMSLFRKANEVQTNYFQFLNSTVSFNCAFQNELDLLIEVMKILQQIGEVLIDLDIKTLALLWKGYMQLSDTYSEHLKMFLHVERPVSFLAKNIVTRLAKITLLIEKDNNSPAEDMTKQVMKDLKIGNFLLKIIVKLTELYNNHLGECHKDLLDLIISLHGYSSSFLCNYTLPDGVLDYIDRNITIAAGPLLAELFGDNLFIKVFYDHNSKYNSDLTITDIKQIFLNWGKNIGFALLVATIMKKLNTSEIGVQKLWTQNDCCSLVRVVINVVERSGIMMNLDTSIKRSESLGVSDIYEVLLTHTAAHIITVVDEQSFSEIEDLLITKVLQPHISTAIFASDLFCLLSRFGNSELRLTQVRYLVGLISKWPENDCLRPEWIFLKRLLDRLLKMLPAQTAQDIISDYRSLLERDIDFTGINFSFCDSNEVYNSINGFLSSTKNDDQMDRYSEMVNKLNTISYSGMPLDDEALTKLNTCLVQLWQSCSRSIIVVNGCQRLEQLMTLLVSASTLLVLQMDTDILCEILNSMLTVLQHCGVSLKLSLLEFLRTLAPKEIRANGRHMVAFKSIAQMFGNLMNDKNIFVTLSALDTFKRFAEITKHVQIISFTARIGEVSQMIKNYLQRSFMPDDETNIIEFEEYLIRLEDSHFRHKCCKNLIPKSKDNSLCNTGNMSTNMCESMDIDSLLPPKEDNKEDCSLVNGKQFKSQSKEQRIQAVLNELNTTIKELVATNAVNTESDTLNTLLNELESCLEKCKNL